MEDNSRLNRIMERRRFGMRPGLDVMRTVLAALGNPQDELCYVHVAGTDGKGATCAMIDSVLRAAGYRVARYTSPHLISLNERFVIDGVPVPDDVLESVVDRVLDVIELVEREQGFEVTFFEALTAVGFQLFADAKPDMVVLETGLGGRLDATNVVADANVLVSVITRIGLDHCEWLGSTHAAIADEKAGIIKLGRPVVCGAMPLAARESIGRVASLHGCNFVAADEYVTVGGMSPLMLTTALRNLPPIDFALFGAFQVENAMTALAAIDTLSRDCAIDVPDHAVVSGLRDVVWPGRCQRIILDGVEIIVDGAHNPDGACALRDSLRLAGVGTKGPVGIIAGFCGDKDVLAHLRIMSAIATCGWATPIRNARSLHSSETAERMQMAGFAHVEACANLAEAFKSALVWAREGNGTLIVCGSLFLAGEALVELNAFPWSVRPVDQNELLIGH